MLEWLLIGWLFWIAFTTGMFLLAALLVKPTAPQFNGFKIHVPVSWRKHLTPEELRAILEHESGHRSHLHVWKNLVHLWCFMPLSAERRMQQELEADDCVSDPGKLADVLLRFSAHPFDVLRAQRLRSRAKQGRQEAGNPTSGMDAPTLRGSR